MTKGLVFNIVKSFGMLGLIPKSSGLVLKYTANKEAEEAGSDIEIEIPLSEIPSLWATSRAFLYNLESLDENIVLEKGSKDGSDILIKLYRDKPKGNLGKLSGEENCWLRLVTGRSEEERRRIKLGPRDLICIELACSTVVNFSGMAK